MVIERQRHIMFKGSAFLQFLQHPLTEDFYLLRALFFGFVEGEIGKLVKIIRASFVIR